MRTRSVPERRSGNDHGEQRVLQDDQRDCRHRAIDGDPEQQRDGTALAHAVVDEAVRGVVPAALPDGPALG